MKRQQGAFSSFSLGPSFEIDMIDLEINTNIGDVVVSSSPLNKVVKGNTNNSFCIYYWNKSVLVIAISNTLKFILFIGVFFAAWELVSFFLGKDDCGGLTRIEKFDDVADRSV